MSFYNFVSRGSDVAQLYIYQEIGASFFSDGIEADQFAKDLKAVGAVKAIDVHINSPGGHVFTGLAIYNLLVQHPAKIHVMIDGLAASIASVIAMAGDTIAIAKNGTCMVHNAHGQAAGYADDIRRTADVLDQLTGQIAETYASRRNIPLDKVKDLMNAESWLTAQQALDLGFVDSIMPEMAIAACAFDPAAYGFRNAPKEFAEAQRPTKTSTAREELGPRLREAARLRRELFK